MTKVKQRPDYTFKYNRNFERHGWLRLTPAYSVKLVNELVQQTKLEHQDEVFILDPFSGTATTGLVAAQAGFLAYMYDINPFLVWLGNAKCAPYSTANIKRVKQAILAITESYEQYLGAENWVPNIHKIERWWSTQTLTILSAMRRAIVDELGEPVEDDINGLVWIGFCRLIIDTSAAAFNHVSMSFQDETTIHASQTIELLFSEILNSIVASASHPIEGLARVYEGDARTIETNGVAYTHVITSPPYPNRISYIRELRPYMYWTKFLTEARAAGELDWKAIGGTWGVATSRLKDWKAQHDNLPDELYRVCEAIENCDNKNALLMSRYVHKYFHDMYQHLAALRTTLATGAKLRYIVGNSTFYNIRVDTERLLALILQKLEYHDITQQIVRKRNSKKELFEFCVSATWPISRSCCAVSRSSIASLSKSKPSNSSINKKSSQEIITSVGLPASSTISFFSRINIVHYRPFFGYVVIIL